MLSNLTCPVLGILVGIQALHIVGLCSCGAMKVLLCVKWNPDRDVEVVSGQLFILSVHSAVVMVSGIASNSVLLCMW